MKRVLALLGIVTVLTACSPAAPTPPAPSPSPALSLPPDQPGPGDHTLAIGHGGVKRDYALHAPPGFQPGQSLPLVLVLHGQPGNSAGAAGQSGMSAIADKAGFLVAYPQGQGGTWTPGTAGDPTSGDVGFVAALVDHLVSTWHADRKRVYVAGFSAGAAFSYRLARELPGRFAAIAPVSGRMDTVAAWTGPLGTANPVSVVTFQGGQDMLSPAWSTTNQSWREAAQCAQPVVTPLANARGRAERSVSTCANGGEHVVYGLPTMAHEWPNSREHPVDASTLIAEFFARHSLT
ncbi:alpha/beta hydrolase family esterase [Catellatospora citrea]|uniref:Hydrolase n=1 Tax=Catellatospora citrea TaxID=53366 RepID=A0A8J3K9S2_9ACTN|nr:PHB depolymerase family esterase [Catellatospora citrea]RKE12833.1 poly(3-hydroxybutyrate) depolymerase [Catellatospora citrea]GIF95926.1 hydrolase [Catellatospora citrea]